MVFNSFHSNSLSISIVKLPLLLDIAHVCKSSSAIVNDLVGALNQAEQLCIDRQLCIASVLMTFLALAVTLSDICREELRVESVDNLESGECVIDV